MWRLLTSFVEDQYEPSKNVSGEDNTLLSLIEPFLEDVWGIRTRDTTQAEKQVTCTGYKGPVKADLALKLDGQYWCVIEAKKLGAPLSYWKKGWKQLDFYAKNDPFRATASHFALTDGKIWKWYKRKPPTQLLPDEPFLVYDVSTPSVDMLIWCLAVMNSPGNVEELENAEKAVLAASAFESWLNKLVSPSENSIKNILDDEAFSALKGRGKWKVQAANVLRSVWSIAIEQFTAQNRAAASAQSYTPGGEPEAEKGSVNLIPPEWTSRTCKWRLGKDSGWNICKNAEVLMESVIRALATKHPSGAVVGYGVLADVKPTRIVKTETCQPKKGWNLKDLGGGYAVNVGSIGNPKKEEYLLSLAENIQIRTGTNPHLQIGWKIKAELEGRGSK